MKTAQQKIYTLLNKTIERDNKVHDAYLLLHSDKLNVHWNYYNQEIVDEDPPDQEDYHYFHTASIGKTFTSVIIVMLYEKGMIDFYDPISKYLPVDIVNGLNTYKGKDYSNRILVDNLLNHTSGIPDFYSGKPARGIKFIDYCLKNPDKQWTPLETINWAKENGISKFPPGEGYNYCDTEYHLLGLIIEKITDEAYHQVLDKFIFDPLQMHHTSLWGYSEPKIKSKHPLTQIYIGKTEVSKFQSMKFDWTGGGIATTSKDLLIFIKALNAKKLINGSTFQLMQNWIKDSRGIYYGYGLMQFRFRELFFTLPKEVITGHSGSIGSFMYYNKTYDLYLIGTFNQSKYEKKHMVFIIKVINIIIKNLKRLE